MKTSPPRFRMFINLTYIMNIHKGNAISWCGYKYLFTSFCIVLSMVYYILTYNHTDGGVKLKIVKNEQLGNVWADNVLRSPYAIDKPNLCNDTNQTLSLLVMVVSAPSNFNERLAIRHTWGVMKQLPDIRLVFVLGYTHCTKLQSRLLSEDLMYGDLLQGWFLDTYYNLSHKSILILKWAHSRCSNAHHVVKIDDDCFLNLPNLLKFLSAHHEISAIYGRVWHNVNPIRDDKNKWSVSEKSFPGNTFPSYTSGPSYVITSGMAIDLLLKTINSGKVGWLSLEDVYVTGLCAEKAKVKRINHDKFTVADFPTICGTADIITYHKITPKVMHLLWWVINDPKWKQRCVLGETHHPLVESVNTILSNLN